MFIVEKQMKSVGIQSEIFLGTYHGERAIQKHAGHGLRKDTLLTFSQVDTEYRDQLRKAEVKVPRNLERKVTDRLIVTDEYVKGTSVFDLINEGKGRDEWHEMMDTVVRASRHKIFIDAKTPNFIKSDGGLYYVDTFPPMKRNHLGHIVPYVQEVYKRDRRLMEFNFGDIKGQATKALSLAKRETPQHFEWMKNGVFEAIHNRIKAFDESYIISQTRAGFPDLQMFYQNGGRLRLMMLGHI